MATRRKKVDSQGKVRDYKKEYDEYHARPGQVKKRAKRNEARKKSGLKKGDPREVHHVGSTRTKLGSKTRVVSKKTNRSQQPKRKGRKKA